MIRNTRGRQHICSQSPFREAIDTRPDVVAVPCPKCGEPVCPELVTIVRNGVTQTVEVLRCLRASYDNRFRKLGKKLCFYAEGAAMAALAFGPVFLYELWK